jgi:hypothetical protein
MKKIYRKPAFVRREVLSKVTAQEILSELDLGST